MGATHHRHTFVTFDLRYSRDIERTRKRAGHSNVKTTQQYGHLVMSDLLYEDGSPVDIILRNRRGAGWISGGRQAQVGAVWHQLSV